MSQIDTCRGLVDLLPSPAPGVDELLLDVGLSDAREAMRSSSCRIFSGLTKGLLTGSPLPDIAIGRKSSADASFSMNVDDIVDGEKQIYDRYPQNETATFR
jgi:hypothetical protein